MTYCDAIYENKRGRKPGLVPVTMLNIGRGSLREHPKDTSEGVTWSSVTTGVAQFPVVHAHTQGNPEGIKWPSVTTGVAQFPVVHAHTQGNPEGIKWLSVTSGSHVTTTKKKTRGKSRACAEHTSGQGIFRSRDFVTSSQNAPLGRILRNFRTGHVTDVTSGHVTSGHVTSACSPLLPRKCPCPYTTYIAAKKHKQNKNKKKQLKKTKQSKTNKQTKQANNITVKSILYINWM